MDIILNPFVTLLTLLYAVLGSMVLAIVVFTIVVRLLTYPLTAKQMKSSQAMTKLQPELKKLQEKYKGDREKISQEQMRLYREYGVNPLGGCLPLLIQFPVFIALYQSILHALAANPLQLLDLSGRLLIPGLASYVPLNNMWLGLNLALPPNISAGGLAAVVGVTLIAATVITTWLQFKVTTPPPVPSADGKKDQTAAMTQSMGTIMPLMYGFFALSFSIGISIYFIVSNLAGILQAVLMGRANFRNAIPSWLTNRSSTPAIVETRAGDVVTPAATTSGKSGKSSGGKSSKSR
ncbi:MAG: YidC/Oxa1 family membrane protein insertase [Anaerolineae bacterium]|nr:YidC/Oxa1 family membrane protein insertase [Anaerolineae bacterium]